MAEAAGALTRRLLRTQHAARCSDWSVLTGRMKVVGHMGLNLRVTCQDIAPVPPALCTPASGLRCPFLSR